MCHWGGGYLLWSGPPAVRSLFGRAKRCVLLEGSAVSAERQIGHIGSWFPQVSFSLANKMNRFYYRNKNKNKVFIYRVILLYQKNGPSVPLVLFRLFC